MLTKGPTELRGLSIVGSFVPQLHGFVVRHHARVHGSEQLLRLRLLPPFVWRQEPNEGSVTTELRNALMAARDDDGLVLVGVGQAVVMEPVAHAWRPHLRVDVGRSGRVEYRREIPIVEE